MHKFTNDEAAEWQRIFKEDGMDLSLDEAREAAGRVYTLMEISQKAMQDPDTRKSVRRGLRESDVKKWSSRDGQLAILLLKRGPARGRRNI